MADPVIRVVEDKAQVEGGHAIVVVEGRGQYVGNGSLGIRRLGYEAAHLSDKGWRIAESRVLADRYEVRDGTVQFYLGPEVTEFLTSDDNVAIDIDGIAGEAVLSWPAITPHYGGKAQGRRVAVKPAAPPPPPPAPETEPPPPPPPPPPVETMRVERMVDAPAPKSSARGWLIGLAVLVLVAGAAIAAYIFYPKPAPAPVAVAGGPAAPVTPAEPAAPAPAGEPGVQDIVRAAGTPQEIYDWAQTFKAKGDVQGMLLLLENAAERGHGGAMLDIARLYDPATFVEGKPFSKANPGQAAKFYRKAEAAGVAEAKPALEALKAVLRKQAAAGDAEAAAALAAYWPEGAR